MNMIKNKTKSEPEAINMPAQDKLFQPHLNKKLTEKTFLVLFYIIGTLSGEKLHIITRYKPITGH